VVYNGCYRGNDRRKVVFSLAEKGVNALILMPKETKRSVQQVHDCSNGNECQNPRKQSLEDAETRSNHELNEVAHEVHYGREGKPGRSKERGRRIGNDGIQVFTC